MPQRPADVFAQYGHVERLGDVAEHPQAADEVGAALQTAVLAGTLTDGRHVQLLHLPATNQRRQRQGRTNQRPASGADQSADGIVSEHRAPAGHNQIGDVSMGVESGGRRDASPAVKN